MAQLLLVAAAVIVNPQGQVLIALRPEGVEEGGLWEFPGGKLALYETGLQALKREVYEELGIQITSARPLIRNWHLQANRKLLLDVWKVTAYVGEPWGREGQLIKWVDLASLADYVFPTPNLPVLKALHLPEDYWMVDSAGTAAEVLARLDSALAQGASLLELHAGKLDQAAYLAVAKAAVAKCQQAKARLLLSGYPALLPQLDGAGLHLSVAEAMALEVRPVAAQHLLAVSCNSSASIKQAELLAADLILLEPEELGWHEFSNLTEGCHLPVYAHITTNQASTSNACKDRVFGLGGQGLAQTWM